MTFLYRLIWTIIVLMLFFQPLLFAQDASSIYRHRPCEVRPPEKAQPKPPPRAEIEESSDRDPVQPAPRPKPKKGVPDDRTVAKADRVQGTRDKVFDYFIAKARTEGRSKDFRWTADDGEVSELRANPNGTVEIVASLVPPRVIPPPSRPLPVVYNIPQTYYQPMPRPGVAARQPFRGAASDYDPDHTCNNCGAERWVVDGWNGDGTHTHVCGRCGNSWRH